MQTATTESPRATRILEGLQHARPQLLLGGMALERQLDETVDQRRVAHPAGLPQLRIHADGGEAGQRVHFVQVEAAVVAAEQEVDAGEAGPVDGEERGLRQAL